MYTNETCPDRGTKVSCTLFGSGEENEKMLAAVQNIRVVMSSLSFLGSAVVICIIVLLRKYRFLSSRLVLYLSIASLLSSIVYMLGRFTPNFSNLSLSDDAFCAALGFFLLMVDWAVVLWFTAITVNLIVNTLFLKRTEKFEFVYIGVAVILPICISCFGFITNDYGVAFGLAGGWCWIRSINVINRQSPDFYCCHYLGGDILRFILWYVPQIVLMLFLLLGNAAIVFKYCRKSKSWQGTYHPEQENLKKMMKDDVKPLLIYPTVYLVTQFFPLVNRTSNWVHPGNPVFELWILHVLTVPLGGVLVALCYLLVDKDTRARLRWSNFKAALHSWRRGEESEVSEYNVQQQVYHQPPESSGNIMRSTRSTRSTRSNSEEPILP